MVDAALSLHSGALPEITFASRGRVPAGKIYGEHCHRSWFIDYISDGDALWYLNGKEWRLAAGRVYFYTPQDSVHGRSETALYVRGVGFHWPRAWKRSGSETLRIPPVTVLSARARRSYEAIFDTLHDVFTESRPGWRFAASGLIMSLLSLLHAEAARQQTKAATAIDRRLALGLSFMERHAARPIKMAEVAEAMNISEPYLRELFREVLGISPLQYLIDLRLKEARRLLIERPELTIGQICREAGFQDTKHFTRLFRSEYCVPPSEFRRGVGGR
jgi:AraC-like DNA-binding protein